MLSLAAALLIAAPAPPAAPLPAVPAVRQGAGPSRRWYVDAAVAPDFGSGTADDPWVSVTFAVSRDEVQSGDSILVAPGDYLNESIHLDGKSLTIVGTEGAAATRLYGVAFGATDPIVTCDDGEGLVVLDGLQFSGGRGGTGCSTQFESVGGALSVCGSANVVARSCVFVANAAERGGSAYVRDAVLALDDCVFLGPGSDARGEALYASNATVTVDGCRFEDLRPTPAQVPQGRSAVALRDSTVAIRDSLFLDNASRLFGGHLWCRDADVLVERTVFAGSVGYAGAGIAVTGGRFEMRASIVRDAIALGSPGAGLFASDTEISLDRCAFERNEVLGSREGGGIALQTSTLVARDTAFIRNKSEVGAGLDVGSGSTATLDGCIFDGNRSQFAGAAVSSVAGSAVIRDTVVVGNDSDGQSSGSIIEGFGRLERCTVFGNVAGSPAVAGGFDVVASIAWRNLPSDVTTTGAVRDSLIGTLDAASETVGVLQSDPRFWGTSELTLRPSSPAIDALPESYGLDADGSRREMGARPFDPAACGPDCDGRVGELGCTAQPNATGATAILGALGSLDLGTDRLALTGQGFPPRQPAVVLAGTQEGTFPLLGESTVLCLGAPFVRAIPEGLTTRPDGSFAADLPLGEAPFAGSAGATWRCQVWFRDPVFGTGLSNSLVLTVR